MKCFRKILFGVFLSFSFNLYSQASWTFVGSTTALSAEVTALIVFNGELYVGGNFSNAGGVSGATYVAKWNGTNWAKAGASSNFDGTVQCFEVIGTTLYAGGNFNQVQTGVPAYRAAKFDGTNWSAVGSGFCSTVYALETDGTNLYATGGAIRLRDGDCVSTGTVVNGIAKWNGSAWSAMGTGLAGGAVIGEALAWYNSELYVGGNFTSVGGVANTDKIAKWNGSAWSAVGSDPFVGCVDLKALYVSPLSFELFAGGGNTIGGCGPDVVKWNGSTWTEVNAGGINNSSYCFTTYSSQLCMGGSHTTPAGRVAWKNGSAWTLIGISGMNNIVRAMTAYNSELYAGGSFTTADGSARQYIARFSDALPIELLSFFGTCNSTIQPFNHSTTLHWQTATETNNDYFTIERMSPSFGGGAGGGGEGWGEVGTVKGAGNSSTSRSYEFVDDQVPSPTGEGQVRKDSFGGVRYYRLKQTDFDGKYEYYGPISVKCEPTDEWELIAPSISPEGGKYECTLLLPQDAQVKVEIIDLQGRTILLPFGPKGLLWRKAGMGFNKGSNLLQVDLKNISSGFYFLKIYNNERQIVKKIIIQK